MKFPQVFRCFAVVLGVIAGGVAYAQDNAPPRVDLVFFGSPSCPVCVGWKRFDYPKLNSSATFQKVHFTEVTKAIKSPIPSASDFPPEIAGYHDAIANSFHGAVGSPMFALLVNGTVMDSWRGVERGNEQLLAEMDKAFASHASSAEASTPTMARNRTYFDKDRLTAFLVGRTVTMKRYDDGSVRIYSFKPDGSVWVDAEGRRNASTGGTWEVVNGHMCLHVGRNDPCFLFFDEDTVVKAGPRNEDARWQVIDVH